MNNKEINFIKKIKKNPFAKFRGVRRDELELREKSREKKERRRRTPELQRPHSIV